ncbi:MAG: hypothetical protein WBV10_02495 [Exiguobacterium marinum]|uniref:Uncharacterized protein n=1 Tax=Exiguobacterium marinum TaxID=273528 RepID=A0ABY7X036_9BACL|nr:MULTISPECIES: hypothetical protein [Exiguobacterium]WDH76480.1 hypothetical protein PTI97_02865 [Exiguobacterium marinum]
MFDIQSRSFAKRFTKGLLVAFFALLASLSFIFSNGVDTNVSSSTTYMTQE